MDSTNEQHLGLIVVIFNTVPGGVNRLFNSSSCARRCQQTGLLSAAGKPMSVRESWMVFPGCSLNPTGPCHLSPCFVFQMEATSSSTFVVTGLLVLQVNLQKHLPSTRYELHMMNKTFMCCSWINLPQNVFFLHIKSRGGVIFEEKNFHSVSCA